MLFLLHISLFLWMFVGLSIELEPPLAECGGINATELTFTSGNYPAKYDVDENACWFFTSSADQIGHLRCDDFCTERGRDILYAIDGRTRWSSILFAKDGCRVDPFIAAKGNEIYVTWSSDIVYTAKGFECYYEAVTFHDCGLRNPCNPLVTPGRYIYAHKDESRYVQCTRDRRCELKSCPDLYYRRYDFRYRDCGERRLEIHFERLSSTCEEFNVSELTFTTGDWPTFYDASEYRGGKCWLFTSPKNLVGHLKCERLCEDGHNGRLADFLHVHDGPYDTIDTRFGRIYGYSYCDDTVDVRGTDPYMFIRSYSAHTFKTSGFSCKYETDIPPGSYYDCNAHNPCDPQLLARLTYFPHRDKTKYVKCGVFLTCDIYHCPELTQWNREIGACTLIPTYDCDGNNPCNPRAVSGKSFYAHRDRTKYVQCRSSDECNIRTCFPGAVWNDDVSACTLASP